MFIFQDISNVSLEKSLIITYLKKLTFYPLARKTSFHTIRTVCLAVSDYPLPPSGCPAIISQAGPSQSDFIKCFMFQIDRTLHLSLKFCITQSTCYAVEKQIIVTAHFHRFERLIEQSSGEI